MEWAISDWLHLYLPFLRSILPIVPTVFPTMTRLGCKKAKNIIIIIIIIIIIMMIITIIIIIIKIQSGMTCCRNHYQWNMITLYSYLFS